MNVSMRSYLTAGTVAVMGASTIALTPVTLQSAPVPSVQLPTISTEVTLAGIQDDLYNFLTQLSTGISDGLSEAGAFVTGLINDGLAGLGQIPGGDVIIQAFDSLAGLIDLDNIQQQLGVVGNSLGAIGNTAVGLFSSIPAALSTAIGELPPALMDSVVQLRDGQLAAALQTTGDALLAPVVSLGSVLWDAGNAAVAELWTIADALVTAFVPEFIATPLREAVGIVVINLNEVVQEAVTLVSGAVDAIVTGVSDFVAPILDTVGAAIQPLVIAITDPLMPAPLEAASVGAAASVAAVAAPRAAAAVADEAPVNYVSAPEAPAAPVVEAPTEAPVVDKAVTEAPAVDVEKAVTEAPAVDADKAEVEAHEAEKAESHEAASPRVSRHDGDSAGASKYGKSEKSERSGSPKRERRGAHSR